MSIESERDKSSKKRIPPYKQAYVRSLIAARVIRYDIELKSGLTELDYGICEGAYILSHDKWNTCIELGFYIE